MKQNEYILWWDPYSPFCLPKMSFACQGLPGLLSLFYIL